MKLNVALLNEMDFKTALTLQEQLMCLRQQNKVPDTMLLMEHPATITMGKRGNEDNVLVSHEVLYRSGIGVFKTNRGGDVTYHGPGQIVGYPILDLQGHGNSVKRYIDGLEEVFTQLLAQEYGLVTTRDDEYRGVWIGSDKIAAIGCSVRKSVTMHGFAFNVNTDLSHFGLILPCGIAGRGVTSLQNVTGKKQNMARVYHQAIDYFCRVFNCSPTLIERHELSNLVKGGAVYA